MGLLAGNANRRVLERALQSCSEGMARHPDLIHEAIVPSMCSPRARGSRAGVKKSPSPFFERPGFCRSMPERWSSRFASRGHPGIVASLGHLSAAREFGSDSGFELCHAAFEQLCGATTSAAGPQSWRLSLSQQTFA